MSEDTIGSVEVLKPTIEEGDGNTVLAPSTGVRGADGGNWDAGWI